MTEGNKKLKSVRLPKLLLLKLKKTNMRLINLSLKLKGQALLKNLTLFADSKE